MRIQVSNLWLGALLMLSCVAVALGQASTGSIRGTVADQNGAVLPNAAVVVKHVGTNSERKATTNAEGIYNADNLQPGEYEVTVEVQGFQRALQRVTVLTGNTQTADFSLGVGGNTSATVLVTSQSEQLNTTDYQVGSVITRERIDAMPSNGRNFLELAGIEPGVSVSQPGNGGTANAFTRVSIAGAGFQLTRISVDGADVQDRVTGGNATNFSQETVQEFQISTFNQDLSNSVGSVGSINVVSRTGGNAFHGSGFFFYRDHNISAYPSLKRSTTLPDPFFARKQTGFNASGPIKKDKLFWFTNFEYTNQTSVSEFSFTRTIGDGGAFANTFNHTGSAPLRAKLFNLRLDYKVNDKTNAFLRYSEDHNHSLQINAINESGWLPSDNNAYNPVVGITSVLTPQVVNDVRLSYNLLTSRLLPNLNCGSSIGCIGQGGPAITVLSPVFLIGPPSGVATDRANRTYQVTDNVSWQRGTHRIRFGGEFEKYVRFGSTATADTGVMTLFGPELVRTLNPTLYAALPASLKGLPGAGPITLADILKLPVQTFRIGVNDASSPAPFNREIARRTNRYRFFFQDGWQVRPNFTFNYGLAWVHETNLRNYDLGGLPEYLRPLLGGASANLSAPRHEYKQFSPALGFAWALGKDKKTVIHGGSGIYWDSDIGATRIAERRVLGPVGNGRVVIDGTGIANPLFGQTGQPQFLNATLPGVLTGQQVANLIPQIRASENARFGVGTDLSVRNIQLLKATATQSVFQHDARTPYSIQVNFGVQREIARNMALTADFVMRRGVAYGGPVGIFDVDLNHFNKPKVTAVDPVTQAVTFVNDPVIPQCLGATPTATLALKNDPNAKCSVGAIGVYQSGANFRYVGLHVKLDKRFADRFQFGATYALAQYTGFNDPVVNLNNWKETYGISAADRKHRVSVTGIWQLPEYKGEQRFLRGALNGWQVSAINSFQSAPPMNSTISTTALDVNGDGIGFFALPGLKWNGFGRGANANDIRLLVAQYNASVIAAAKPIPAGATAAQIAACTLNVNGTNMCGPRTPQNQRYPLITLPANFSNGDTFMSNDVRVSRKIKITEKVSLSLIGDVFNVFNIANLAGYTSDLQSATFGQPTTRTNQIFGSGGPRAFQLAARLSF